MKKPKSWQTDLDALRVPETYVYSRLNENSSLLEQLKIWRSSNYTGSILNSLKEGKAVNEMT